MNRQKLIQQIVLKANISPHQADEALSGMLEAIAYKLSLQQPVNIAGFGRFYASNYAARMGRHPQTGEPMQVAAHYRPQFKPYASFTDAIQKPTNEIGREA